jgi:hypothetical protein
MTWRARLWLLAAFAGCSSTRSSEPRPSPEPTAPIVGTLITGEPWPEPISAPLRWVEIVTTLDAHPITIHVGVACGTTVGGLTIEREFVRSGSERTVMTEPDAVEVADPVGAALELATRMIRQFERQGFEVTNRMGGSVEAITQMGSAFAKQLKQGERPAWKDVPRTIRDAPIDEAKLRHEDAWFVVAMRRDPLSRLIEVRRAGESARVQFTEAQECLPRGTLQTADPTIPKKTIR